MSCFSMYVLITYLQLFDIVFWLEISTRHVRNCSSQTYQNYHFVRVRVSDCY
jgi:hypothetical protein